jgi:hypothetical protein
VTCRVVCISRITGAGGEEVGRLVADSLGWRYVDEEIVANAAARGGILPEDVADEERRKSLLSRVLVALEQGSGEAWALRPELGGVGAPGGEQIRALIRDAVAKVAAQGRAVVVAHAASYVVPHGPEALRVLVTASPRTREARVRDVEAGVNAARAIRESDAARRDYLKRFYDVDEELPTHYDLVVNTDVLSIERAAQLLTQAAST